MGKPLLIIGTSGYAKEIAQIARRSDPNRERWDRISYVASAPAEIGQELLFGRVEYCDEDIFSGKVASDTVIGLGEPPLRMKVAARFTKLPTLTFPNVIDPASDIDFSLNTIGIGNVIHRNVTITFGVVMGDFNLLNKCLLGHDTKLGSFNTVNPLACVLSNSLLGDGCMVGAGAHVLPRTKMADRTTVGAGALVRHDIDEPGHVYVGNPARKLR